MHATIDTPHPASVTSEGAAWLAACTSHPRSTLALWNSRPAAPVVVPCGTGFDAVSVPAVFGRRVLDQLWEAGPGSGPVASHRGRTLLFAAPGTAQRLPSLLAWEEWHPSVPPPLCHGAGDAITVPPVHGAGGEYPPHPMDSRWLVAPDSHHPWLPGPEVLLWACVRAARSGARAAVRISIFPRADQGAKVYDVSRRR
ncbi:bifunctional DNA primase/polymerase [Streptomyces sp. YIM 130001]|uniref:bifunctional DNA primase/polymerase n=1 Tax=Streptomyces sp. YIM 130001 TaxID=2259644 RepID=UPI001F09C3C8|nr:bifunctional DNA primase/polymerase [Streptomyces sp. YIM 130001]